MTIYADVLVIVNLYMDFLLLRCVKGFLHLNCSGKRLVLGAATGAAASLLGLLPMPLWTGPFMAGACALASAATAFAPMRPRRFLQCWLCMWLFSFLLAGFLLFLMQFAPPGYMTLVGGAVYLNLSLPTLFLATCIAYVGLSLFRRMFPRESSGTPACKLVIRHKGSQVQLFAKADSGNALREPFSGLPVIVCHADCLKGVAPSPALNFLSSFDASSTYPDTQGLRLIPFETVGGQGLLPAFKPDAVTITKTGQELDCYIALTQRPFAAGEFSAIYNPDLFPQ